MNRREFIRLSTAGAAASFLPLPLFAQPARAEFRTIRRNVGIFTDRGGTIGWLLNLGGVIVVDSQFPDTAENFLVELREVGGRPVHALINSHHHGDHTGGNGVLRYVVRELVAHTNSAANQRRAAAERGTEEEQTYPDTTFDDTWSMEMGDESVRAVYYGPAHTNGDVITIFEQANIVHLGDLVNNRGYPNIDAGAGGTVHGWIDVLGRIPNDFDSDTIYIFGHGGERQPITGKADDLAHQRDYLSALVEAAGRAIQEGKSREEATQLQSLPGFEHFTGDVARLALGLGIAYDELRAGSGQ